jgi:hypothetical protein
MKMFEETVRKSLSLALLAAAIPFTVGCAKAVPDLEVEESTQPQPAPAQVGGLSGVVLETMDAADYTYVRVDLGDKEIWAAAPQAQVAVGDRVTIPPGAPMQNFHSPSMDRTFELIYFVGQIVPEGAQPTADEMPPGHPPLGGESVAPEIVAGMEKATNGHTIAEVYDRKSELSGQRVVVRGKVVKSNQGILGTNWLHIQDGTGTAVAGTNDLTVTTQAIAAVGDTVVVVGALELGKDFGAGYRYDAIVTDAEVTVE